MRSSTHSGGAVKRQRELQQEDTESMMLLALVESYRGTLAWLQLCNPQHFFRHSCVCLPPRLPRPFAGSPVYVMSLSHSERLRAVGCGLKGKFVRMLLWVVYGHSQAHWNRRACHQIMLSIVRRVASKQMAAVRDDAAKAAEMLCASGQFAAAEVPLQRAIHLGDLPSLALKAWLLMDDREGVAQDLKKAYELAKEGERASCHHCQGVLARCYSEGAGCNMDEERSIKLARMSSASGSKYGQFVLGVLSNSALEVSLYQLAAKQGLDSAQAKLGKLHFDAADLAESLRWYRIAAAQGHPDALFGVGVCHINLFVQNKSVCAHLDTAISYFERAHAAGHSLALRRVGMCKTWLKLHKL